MINFQFFFELTKDDQPIIYDDDARKYFNMTGSVKNYTFDDKKNLLRSYSQVH